MLADVAESRLIALETGGRENRGQQQLTMSCEWILESKQSRILVRFAALQQENGSCVW